MTFLGYPISQSATCKTSVPAEITLRSGPGFDPMKGGTLTGEFTIPPVSGCGQADSMITSMVSGPGNTVQITLTPCGSPGTGCVAQQGNAMSAAGSVSATASQSAK